MGKRGEKRNNKRKIYFKNAMMNYSNLYADKNSINVPVEMGLAIPDPYHSGEQALYLTRAAQ